MSQSPYESARRSDDQRLPGNARRSGGSHAATRSTLPDLPINLVKAVEGSEG